MLQLLNYCPPGRRCLVFALLCCLATSLVAQAPPILVYKPLPLGRVGYSLGEQKIKPGATYRHLKQYHPEAANDFRSYRRLRTVGLLAGVGFVGIMMAEIHDEAPFSERHPLVVTRRVAAVGFFTCSMALSPPALNRLHRSMQRYNEAYGYQNYRKKLPWWKSFLTLSI